MAIVREKAGSTYASAGTTISPSLGGTATANNLLVCGVAQRYGDRTYSTPSGWTLLGSIRDTTGGAGYLTQYAFYKIAVGTETGVTLTSNQDYEASAFIAEYSGLSTSSVLDATDTTPADSAVSSGSYTFYTDALNPTTADGLALAIAGTMSGSVAATLAPISGYTEFVDKSSSPDTYSPRIAVAQKIYSDGSSQTPGYTGNSSAAWKYGLIGAVFNTPAAARNVSHLLCLGVG